jgi:hypothetical protein
MTDRAKQKRRNIILAIVLALVAAGFYFGFIIVNMQGPQ